MKTAYMGLFLAFALILSYIETLIPFTPGMPGIKLGLANLAVLLCMYLLGSREALLLTVVKALLSGVLFGNLFMIWYSLTGALLSFLVMTVMKRCKLFHLPVVSGAGGVMHNMGQLLVAFLAVETYSVIYYMPFLIIAGLVTGIIIGVSANLLLPYLKKMLVKGAAL
jgi:heptaprenyl diphosphate synthase